MEWKEENGNLVSVKRFRTQTELVEFLLKIAKLADAHDHHPDVDIRKAFELKLMLKTHSVGKITEKDYLLVEEIGDLEKVD